MALQKCTECKNKVSSKAITCPNCGAPVVTKKKKGCIFKVFQLFGIVFVISLIFGVLTTFFNSPSEEATSLNSEKTTVTETQQNQENELLEVQQASVLTDQDVEVQQTKLESGKTLEEQQAEIQTERVGEQEVLEASQIDVQGQQVLKEEQVEIQTEQVLESQGVKNPVYSEKVNNFCYAFQASLICDNLQMRIDTKDKFLAELGETDFNLGSKYGMDCLDGYDQAFSDENNGLCTNTWEQYGCSGNNMPKLVQENSSTLGMGNATLCSY